MNQWSECFTLFITLIVSLGFFHNSGHACSHSLFWFILIIVQSAKSKCIPHACIDHYLQFYCFRFANLLKKLYLVIFSSPPFQTKFWNGSVLKEFDNLYGNCLLWRLYFIRLKIYFVSRNAQIDYKEFLGWNTLRIFNLFNVESQNVVAQSLVTSQGLMVEVVKIYLCYIYINIILYKIPIFLKKGTLISS